MARLHPVISILLLAIGLGIVTLPTAVMAQVVDADDSRHAGYYYPEPGPAEAYKPRSKILSDSDRERRIGFVTLLAVQQFAKSTPRFAMIAKGSDAEKLIIVAIEDGYMDTIYRGRAVLAMLTAIARSTPLLQEMNVAETFTFLDLLYLMGFTQVTISDGKDFAHTIVMAPGD